MQKSDLYTRDLKWDKWFLLMHVCKRCGELANFSNNVIHNAPDLLEKFMF